MVYVPVQCPHCHSTEVIKAGKQANGTHRYRYQNEQCTRWGSWGGRRSSASPSRYETASNA